MIAVFLLSAAACSYRRNLPQEEFSTPRPEQEPRREAGYSAPTPEQQPGNRDNLSKSDKDAVEENINGFDISDDEAITRQAGILMMTQIHTAVIKRIVRLAEAKTESRKMIFCWYTKAAA